MKYLDVLNGCFPCETSVKYLDQTVKILFLLLCQIEERVARDKPFWEIILLRLDMMAMVSLSRQEEDQLTIRIFAYLIKNILLLVCISQTPNHLISLYKFSPLQQYSRPSPVRMLIIKIILEINWELLIGWRIEHFFFSIPIVWFSVPVVWLWHIYKRTRKGYYCFESLLSLN